MSLIRVNNINEYPNLMEFIFQNIGDADSIDFDAECIVYVKRNIIQACAFVRNGEYVNIIGPQKEKLINRLSNK